MRLLARGVALFLGAFSFVNSYAQLRSGFEPQIWWIDLRPLPAVLTGPFLLVAAALLVAFAVGRSLPAAVRWSAFSAAVLLALAATCNCAQVALLAARGAVEVGFALPVSAIVASALSVVALGLVRSAGAPMTRRHGAGVCLCASACAVVFAVAQMFCFGKTDYRRPADAIVVFGCKAYADGRPSDALADRVRTACELYHVGLAPLLVFSGGPGQGPVHETESMRRFAVSLGVPDAAIVLDPHGLNTQATVRNTTPIFSKAGARRVLAVSHFYHLPRVKMSYQRAGWDVYTVPARETYVLSQLPYLMLREVAAFWVYYVRSTVA